ncbi:MAG: hypothetical protein ACOX42_05060 [Clostridia bacterium]|nr:3-dehydroquinate synthase [Clostridiales bacterium]
MSIYLDLNAAPAELSKGTGFDRGDAVLALGGGVTGDLARLIGAVNTTVILVR